MKVIMWHVNSLYVINFYASRFNIYFMKSSTAFDVTNTHIFNTYIPYNIHTHTKVYMYTPSHQTLFINFYKYLLHAVNYKKATNSRETLSKRCK